MRSLTACVTAVLLLLVSAASGQQRPTQTSLSAKQKSVEQRLQETARIDIEGRESITVGEILTQIQEQHGLRVQLYRGTAMLTALCLNGFDESGSSQTYGGVASTVPGVVVPQNVQYFSPPPTPTYAAAPAVATTSTPVTNGSVSPAVPANLTTPVVIQGAENVTPVVPAPPTPEPVTPQPVEPQPVTPQPQPAVPQAPESPSDSEPSAQGISRCDEVFRSHSVSTTTLHGDLTVEDVLRAVIAQIPTPLDMGEMASFPVTYTHAYDWDLLIGEDGVYITTEAQTNLHKIARVYRVPAGGDFTPEEQAEVVRRTIRPWSWRDQIEEVVNRVEIDIPPGAMLPSITNVPELVTSNVIGTSVVQATSEGAAAPPQDDSRTTIVPPEAS
ncbi:MAG: hypothetical protein ACF8PG_07475, partial [Maioricimonas sp. JB045]